ncbi:fumarylacetoacetate hydrolase family protein [Mycobacterium sp. Aquia_216]|uniref:2-keto-4-pentenoate hydratase n=1 Tax=Mycobacterium sp. Aquia_216 TaxID=2991729 RepID=UPI00227B308E|nr:fumarylacetoacetate hydrolase family protein [Mycobacterium sp. Aquia_216]WAJ44262.1 fumarylacetoacetate hydrolase family protein [Mycobacterium sp. Aquia_216]
MSELIHPGHAIGQRSKGPGIAPDTTVVGVKVALTSPEAQRRVGCSRPIWGWLTDDMELPNGAQIAGPHIASLRAEAELVFILGSDLRGPGITHLDVLAATHAICAGIELPTRFPTDVEVSVDELIARNALAAKFVLGHSAAGWRDLDLTLLGVVVQVNGEPVSSGTPAAVLGHPANAVASVVNDMAYTATLSADQSDYLRAGQIVFTGGITAAVALTPGISVDAHFAHLGSVGVHTACDKTAN